MALQNIAMRLFVYILSMIALVAAIPNAGHAGDIEVDAELVLAVDVSRSMTPNELEIQRRGYAAALASDEVISAITGGLIGRVAIIYVEWAGYYSHRVIVDWRVISSKNDAQAFADELTAKFDSSLRRTSISGALDYASKLFETNAYISNRQIIDISGDGPNNQGRAVLEARAEALEKGIVINGLPLMTKEGMGSIFHLDNLDDYYRNCVIGGPGSFVLPVTDWQQFPAAVRHKIVLELAGTHLPPIVHAAFTRIADDNADCLVGEKIWEQIQQNWYEQ